MKAHVVMPPASSKALSRVAYALTCYAIPGVELVDVEEANIVVMHVIGRQDATRRRIKQHNQRGRQVALIQYCVRSTMRPTCESWLPLWDKAALVWSYYPLREWCKEEGIESTFPFYQSPLGVDSQMFYPRNNGKRVYVIGTSGLAWTSEGVREAGHAAARVEREVFHLGSEMKREHFTCASGLTDDHLADWYSQCEFTAALRRDEGFELPAAEGLLCGARPICFDRLHYCQWYGDWAEYIHEGTRHEVIGSLETLFRQGARPVTDQEVGEARKLFDWGAIVRGFWKRLV